jgi:hypothetical protein
MMAEEKKCKKEGKTGLDLSISRQTRQECLRDQPEEWVIRNRRIPDARPDFDPCPSNPEYSCQLAAGFLGWRHES